MIRITIHADVRQPWTLTPYTVQSLDELFDLLDASYDVCEDKTASDLIVPVAVWRDRYREARNIDTMSRLFAADLDGLGPDQEQIVLQALEGVSCIVYTTHSHRTPRKGGRACYRALIELDREYPLSDFSAVWAAMNRFLGGQIDPATSRHPELGYYLPSAPASGGSFAARSREPGRVLCVDDLVAQGRELGAEPFAPAPGRESRTRTGAAPNKIALTQQARRWTRSLSPVTANAGHLALLILAEKESLEEGERNNRLFELAMAIAQTWPEADPAPIEQAFLGLGWDHINRDREFDPPTFSQMIARCQDYVEARAEEELISKVREATGGGRSETITDAEIEGLIRTYGETWTQHVIALLDRDCYLLQPDGTYFPGRVVKDNLFVAARDYLPVFGDHVQFTYEVPTEKGVQTKKKTLPMFLEEYATVVQSVVYDWTRQGKIWSPREGKLCFHAPGLAVEPKGHEEIQEWLDACGDPDLLCDMISQMPHHDRMLPVLVLTGEKASGKTLLANGLAQMYDQDAPVAAGAAFGEFNANLLKRCPIVLMDEKATDHYRREGTSLIRRFVTTSEWQLNEKFQTRIVLRGFLRLVVCANNDQILATDEDMGTDDREAFGERLVRVDMTPSKRVLDRYGSPYIQEHWIRGGMLAEHFRYLSEEWEVRNPGRRMAVERTDDSFHRGLASYSGTTRDVLHWLVAYLRNPTKADQAHLPIARRGGQLRVHHQAVLDGWSMYLDGQRLPTPHAVANAIRALGTGRTQRQKVHGLHAYVIDRGLLEAGIEAYGADLDLDILLDGPE